MDSSSSSLSSSTTTTSSSRRSCQSVPVTPVAGKVVRFHPAVVALQIQPMYDILNDGVEHLISINDACDMLWYNETEYSEFANEARSDREFIDKLRERSATSADATTAVLMEQAYLRSTLMNLQSSLELQSSITSITSEGSDISIAEAYVQNCHKAREQALLTGLRDAKWVQDEYNKKGRHNSSSRRHGHHHRTSRRSSRSSTMDGEKSEYRQQRERFLKAKKSSSAPRRSKAMQSSTSTSSSLSSSKTTTLSAAIVVAAAAYNNSKKNAVRC